LARKQFERCGIKKVKKGKDISVTGHGGERLRLPHYLDKRLIDGSKVKVKISLLQAMEAHTVARG
jgi:hypothetical protein